jgi:trehalose/maltose hydrolase-like predicted phosphorylase
VLARMDPARAWTTFRTALVADLDDTQGGTTKEGVHLGVMAGSLDVITRTFAGLRTDDDTLYFDPRLPAGLRGARFEVQYRGQRIQAALDHEGVQVSADPCAANPRVRVRVAGKEVDVVEGATPPAVTS